MKVFLYLCIVMLVGGCSASDETLADLIGDCTQQSALTPEHVYAMSVSPDENVPRVFCDSNYVYVVKYLRTAKTTEIVMLDTELNAIAKREVTDFIFEDVSSGVAVGRNSSSSGVYFTDTVAYQSIDLRSGEIDLFYEVELPTYSYSDFQSSGGKHYYLQVTKESGHGVLYQFDPQNNYAREPLLTLDTLLAKNTNRYAVYQSKSGALTLLISTLWDMAKIDVETQEIEYLHNTTLQDRDVRSGIDAIKFNNEYTTISDPSPINSIVNIHTFDQYQSDYEIPINDTLSIKGRQFINLQNDKTIDFNQKYSDLHTSSSVLPHFYIQPWEYYTVGNYIYMHDNQITRGKLLKYNLSSHCTESLQKLDSRLVKMDQANGVAYILDDEGLKRFVLD